MRTAFPIEIALISGALLGLVGCAPPRGAEAPSAKAPKAAPPSKKSAFDSAEAALREGNWRRAATHYEEAIQADPIRAGRGLAEVALITGRYEEVDALLGTDRAAPAAVLRARALRSLGRLDEALSILEAAPEGKRVDQLIVDLARAEILLELGKRTQAEPVLMRAIEAANSDGFSRWTTEEQARAWGIVGQAAHALRSPTDANDAFNRSETLAEATLPILLARAELFLEKFDFAHAEEVITEAQKLAPHHPDVVELEARLLLESALAFVEVETRAHAILKTNPRHTGARFLLAGVELRNLGLRAAEAHVAAGLEVNPRALELLSLRAAIRFLGEDPEGFERVVDQVLELNPEYAEIFRIVGDYAEWEHRYPDIEKLMRRAVRLDREDGRARALLGLTLVRSGSDAAGILELRRAFELDPFNVRVLNTLDLYENIIPTDYVEIDEGPFRYRFPKAEAELLGRYVPDLLRRAYEQMQTRYAYEPRAPIGIEIYESQEQFSVRTSGLPRTAIQGVCFGRKLATMSPIASPGNLGMTLWHELAHVFHIGLSENRVPRWFTEGFAEWETKQRDVGWSRELDLDLYRALRDDALPSLESMSRAFTHARRMQDVATAYYASGEIASWIVEDQGAARAVKILSELGRKRLPNEVIPEVLGASFSSLDERFRNWAQKSVSRFDGQFVSLEVRETVDELEEQAKARPDDRALTTRIAIAHLREGKVDDADALLQKVLTQGFEPQAAFFRARILLSQERKKEARAFLERLLAEGHDGYEVRMVLARLFLADRAHDKAEEHVQAASRFDPRAEEPLGLLATFALREKDEKKELEALRRWATLSEHDPLVHRRLVEVLIDSGNVEEAVRAGSLAVWTDLAGMETHRLYGLALARKGDLKKAEFEWESALLCPGAPKDLVQLGETWKQELVRLGQGDRAAQIDERIAKGAKMLVAPGP